MRSETTLIYIQHYMNTSYIKLRRVGTNKTVKLSTIYTEFGQRNMLSDRY